MPKKSFKIDKSLRVVWFSELRRGSEYDSKIGFHHFSYGEAAATLIEPQDLIEEISDRQAGEDDYKELLEDLAAIPTGVLVGFEC